MPLVAINNSLFTFDLSPRTRNWMYAYINLKRDLQFYVMDGESKYAFRPFHLFRDEDKEVWAMKIKWHELKKIMKHNENPKNKPISYSKLIVQKNYVPFNKRTGKVLCKALMSKDTDPRWNGSAPVVVEVPENTQWEIKTIARLKTQFYGKERIFINGEQYPLANNTRSRLWTNPRDSQIHEDRIEHLPTA